MPRLVMKFGGTSVATVERIKNGARHVKREVDAGYDVAVVVSAMAGKTNELAVRAQKTRSEKRARWVGAEERDVVKMSMAIERSVPTPDLRHWTSQSRDGSPISPTTPRLPAREIRCYSR